MPSITITKLIIMFRAKDGSTKIVLLLPVIPKLQLEKR